MKLKNMILTALLLAIGLVLHQIVPPIMGGMKPDFLLSMLFIALLIDNNPKNVFVAGLLSGIFSALSTGFPGGQIANMCDKIITAVIVYLMIKALDKLNPYFTVPVIAIVGTIISGTVFLGTALLVVGSLPLAFPVLFTTIVLPATVVNTIATCVIHKVVFTTRNAIGKV
jgi:hypothetical protein